MAEAAPARVTTATRPSNSPTTIAPRGRNRPRRPRRLRRWFIRVGIVIIAIVLVIAAGIAVLWPLSPSVSRLPQLVPASLARHHAPALSAPPDPDRVGEAVIATENSRFYSDRG